MSKQFHSDPPEGLTTFRVQVGHTETTVQGRTREDAIREARRALCRDMPRMWDVIHKLTDEQFIVEPVK